MGAIIETDNIEKAKQIIKSAKNSPIIAKSQNLDFDRKLLEYGKFDILLDIEKTTSANIRMYDKATAAWFLKATTHFDILRGSTNILHLDIPPYGFSCYFIKS